MRCSDILKKIQGDLSAFRNSVDERFGQVERRSETLETLVRKQRRDAAAMLVMMRSAAGDFDERVTEVEERMAALEAQKS